MNASDFWKPFERSVRSYRGALDLIHGIFDRWQSRGRVFAWRGQVNAAWPLHSSLYRRLLWTNTGGPPDEDKLYTAEGRVLTDVHRWGLHRGDVGRLSILNQLAMLQHFGAPTRLIDVTFNPLIGLWFAVEEKWDDGRRVEEDSDGRLFAVDVTDRLINERDDYRAWEDCTGRPWNADGRPDMWCGSVFAWRPAAFESRIAAQQGGFLFGGVPKTKVNGKPLQWPRGPSRTASPWRIDKVRRSTSIPIRVHKVEPKGGGVREGAAYTIRVSAAAKKAIRRRLDGLFGYNHSTIYPDFSGFASFGTSMLKTRKP